MERWLNPVLGLDGRRGGGEVHRWLNPLLLLDLRLKMLALSKKPTILFYFAFYKFNTEEVRRNHKQ